MGIFRSGAVVRAASESLAERYNTAQALHGAAVAIFQDVASDLAEAERQYRECAAEAQEEMTRLSHIQAEAYHAAERTKNSTVAILNLTRGITNG